MSESPAEKCPRCKGGHTIYACPHVKAIEIDGDDKITRVEFLTPIDFPREEPKPAEAPDGDSYPRLGQRRPQ